MIRRRRLEMKVIGYGNMVIECGREKVNGTEAVKA